MKSCKVIFVYPELYSVIYKIQRIIYVLPVWILLSRYEKLSLKGQLTISIRYKIYKRACICRHKFVWFSLGTVFQVNDINGTTIVFCGCNCAFTYFFKPWWLKCQILSSIDRFWPWHFAGLVQPCCIQNSEFQIVPCPFKSHLWNFC